MYKWRDITCFCTEVPIQHKSVPFQNPMKKKTLLKFQQFFWGGRVFFNSKLNIGIIMKYRRIIMRKCAGNLKNVKRNYGVNMRGKDLCYKVLGQEIQERLERFIKLHSLDKEPNAHEILCVIYLQEK